VSAPADTGAETFAAAFAEAWAHPTPEGLVKLLHPEVRLEAPMMETTVGHDAAIAEFRRLFELLSDVHGDVQRWSARDDVVFIEWTLSATFAGRPLQWRLVDRFLVADGLGLERVAYFDPLPLAAAIARNPRGWRRWWRSGLGPPLGRRHR
jgi:ketosteroid isomerase-like protein